MKLAPNPIYLTVFSGIISVSGITFVLAADPAKDKSTDSQDNPLRVVDSSQNDPAKKNKVVRGSVAEQAAEGSIDFIIVDPADPSNTISSQPVTIQQDTQSLTIHHSEYESLHSSAESKPVAAKQVKVAAQPSHTIVYGEDTDNPEFTSAHKLKSLESNEDADSEPPALIGADELAELHELTLEELNQQTPELIDGPPLQDPPSLEAKNDGPDSRLTSKPTLRRPKPIFIEPIETSLPKTDPKQNTAQKNAKPDSPSSNPARVRLNPSVAKRSTAEELRAQRAAAAISYYAENPESVAARSPWAVMHAILPYGANAELVYKNQRVNAIAWMCANKVCKTQSIFTPVGNSFKPNVGGGVQGHEGQFLAILAQSGVSSSYPLYVSNQKFTVSNLVQYEMATCKPKTELTFKLIGLTYYLGTKQAWRSRDRQVWNVERLLSEELAQPVNGAACGGVHRLMGIHIAVKQRLEEGQPLNGKFAVADKYIRDYKDYAWSLQNPDGSFSTNWFESRGMENNDERKVQTTGHILEWLIFSSTPEELKAHRTDAAIDFLLSKIYDKRDYKWPIGPRGHAMRAIVLYQAKCLDGEESIEADSSVAKESSTSTRTR